MPCRSKWQVLDQMMSMARGSFNVPTPLVDSTQLSFAFGMAVCGMADRLTDRLTKKRLMRRWEEGTPGSAG